MTPDQVIERTTLADLTERLTAARAKTWDAVRAIAEKMEPGMTESEGRRIAQQTLAEMGVKKFWHPCHVRFGASTALSFSDAYTDAVLKDEDIFYVDIGPVWDGIEGDAGATFVRGSNSLHLKCKRDAEAVFKKTAGAWREKRLTGSALYQFAEEEARRLGWNLAPSYVRGHRLGEFPHSFYTKSKISAQDFVPATARWVLEIQLSHPEGAFGAFFEDILQ